MSLSLTLIFENEPIYGTRNNKVLGYDSISLGDASRECEFHLSTLASPLGLPLQKQTDEGWGLVTEDPYGKPLTFVTAHQLWKSRELLNLPSRDWNAALQAFVHALPPHTRIILWWS